MKKTKLFALVLPLAAAGILLLAGCDSPVDPGPGPGSGTDAVTGVAVKPGDVQVEKGGTQQFTATVTGTGEYSREVTWSVSGGGAGTSISGSGLLSVAADEGAGTLTVTAASNSDSSKKGSAEVTLVAGIPEDARLILYVSEDGDNDEGDGSIDAPFLTAKRALAELKTLYAADSAWPNWKTDSAAKAYIVFEGLIEETGTLSDINMEEPSSTIAISTSYSKPYTEYPPIELRGRSSAAPGELVAQPGKRVLCVFYNVVTLGPFLTLSGGQLTANNKHGGGLYVGAGGQVTLDGAAIRGNAIGSTGNSYGGGVYISGQSGKTTTFTMLSGTIIGNTVAGGTNSAGGGVYIGSNAVFTMTGGRIYANTVTGPGASSTNVIGGNGVYVNSASGVFKLGGEARIDTGNTVMLNNGAKITLVSALSGPAGLVARIDLFAVSSPESTWKDKVVLDWEGPTGTFPVERFALGNFRLGSADGTGVNTPIAANNAIDGDDGKLKPKVVSITRVTLDYAEAVVDKGAKFAFKATVTGIGFPDESITWSVSGKTSGSTSISNGTLTVGADEGASTLTVTAASVADPSKSASAQVTVESGGSRIWYVSAAGSDSNHGRSAAKPFATAGKALEAIKSYYALNKTSWPGGDAGAAKIIISGTVYQPTTDIATLGRDSALAIVSGAFANRDYPPLILEGNPGNPGVLRPLAADTRVLRLKYAKLTLGQHLTLTGGVFTTGDYNNLGGGVYAEEGSELILDGARIVNNGSAVTREGGGVYIAANNSYASTLRILSGSITGNTAQTKGGGVCLNGASTKNVVFEMEGGSIANNNVVSGGGSAIFVSNGEVTISGGAITGNTGTYNRTYGGAIYLTSIESSFSLGGTVDFGTGINIRINAQFSSGITLLSELSGMTGVITVDFERPDHLTWQELWMANGGYALLKGLVGNYPVGKFILGKDISTWEHTPEWPITGVVIDPADGKLKAN